MNKYIIITPVKNEASFIEQTIISILNQILLPRKWIIVDDGSTDDTCLIINKYRKNINWILLHRLHTEKEIRSGGSKVVNAFNAGYKFVKNEDWDFIVKLDGDLILPSNYFEEIAKTFINNPKVGMAGGIILNKIGNKYIKEGKNNYHIRGAFKSYTRNCFIDIGGLKPIWNWDGLDEMEAMYKGWETKCVNLEVIHLRQTSGAYNKYLHAEKSGFEAYKIRMSILLFAIRFINKLFSKPFFLYSIFYSLGYIRAIINKPEYLIDREFASFINKFHFKRIFKFIK